MAKWKKTVLGITGVLGVVVGLFLIIVAMQPGEFHIRRSAKMKAAPAVVFTQVNNFHNWEAWSPWAKLDPNCKTTYAGPAAGVGAVFAWDGNKKVGAGRMTITE